MDSQRKFSSKTGENIQSAENICQICLRQAPTSPYFQCRHQCCESCCKQQISQSIKHFKKIQCLYGCNSSIRDSRLKRVNLEAEQSKKLERMKKIKNAEIQNFHYCPLCQNLEGILVKKQNAKEKTLLCNKCSKIFCQKCLLPQHNGDCNNLVNFYFNNYAVCPSCQNMIEKSVGCNHIKCKCKKQFCYICEQDWSSSHQCKIFNQTRKSKRLQDLRRNSKLTKEDISKIQNHKKVTEIKKLRMSKEKTQKRKSVMKKKIIQAQSKPVLFSQLLKWFKCKVHDQQNHLDWLKYFGYMPLLILGQFLLLLFLPIALILNLIIGWMFVIPFINILDIFLSDENSGACNFLLTIWSIFIFPFWLCIYFLFLFFGQSMFWSSVHLIDIKNILVGELPIWISLKRVHLEHGLVSPPICKCRFKISCPTCEEVIKHYLFQGQQKHFLCYHCIC